MYYSNLLKITDTSTDTFWGILAIVTLTVMFYAFAYSRFIASKTQINAQKAKRIAIEQMNLRCALAKSPNSEDADVEDDEVDHEEYEDEDEYDDNYEEFDNEEDY